MIQTKTDIYCVQETGGKNDEPFPVQNHLFIIHGHDSKRQIKVTRGGVAIILSPNAQLAWKRAGQPEPIRANILSSAARIIGLELHFNNYLNKRIKLFIISAYLPCSAYDTTDYELALAALEQIIQSRPKGSIPLIYSDTNASIGINTSGEPTPIQKIIGLNGKPHTNKQGSFLKEFLLDNNICAASTYLRQKGHNTWVSPQIVGYQLDHLPIP